MLRVVDVAEVSPPVEHAGRRRTDTGGCADQPAAASISPSVPDTSRALPAARQEGGAAAQTQLRRSEKDAAFLASQAATLAAPASLPQRRLPCLTRTCWPSAISSPLPPTTPTPCTRPSLRRFGSLRPPPPAPARGAVREASSSLELLHLLLHGHHRHEAQCEKLALDQQVRPPPLPCLTPSRSPAHHSAVLPTCSGDADLEQRGHQGCGPRRRRVRRAVRPRVRRARRQQVPKGGRRGGWVVFFFFLSVHSDSHPCSRLLVQQRPSRRRRRKRAQRRVDTRSHRSRERDEWRWRRRRRAVCAAAFNTAGGAYGLPGAESGMGVR